MPFWRYDCCIWPWASPSTKRRDTGSQRRSKKSSGLLRSTSYLGFKNENDEKPDSHIVQVMSPRRQGRGKNGDDDAENQHYEVFNTCHPCYTIVHTSSHSFFRTSLFLSTTDILILQWQKQRPREMNLTTLQVAEPRCKPRQPASRSHALDHCTMCSQGVGEKIQTPVEGMLEAAVSPLPQEWNCSHLKQGSGRIREPQQLWTFGTCGIVTRTPQVTHTWETTWSPFHSGFWLRPSRLSFFYVNCLITYLHPNFLIILFWKKLNFTGKKYT